jgi:hypothetical protein
MDSTQRVQLLDAFLSRSWTDENISKIFSHFPFLESKSIYFEEWSRDAQVLLISDAAVVALAQSCPNLKNVAVKYSRYITDKAVKALAHGCPLLESVNFSFCFKISSIGICMLAESCRNNISIDLSRTKISDDAVQNFFVW